MKEHLLYRYSELFGKRGTTFEIVENTLYYNYNGIIMPFSPANERVKITEVQAKGILTRLNGKLLRYTDGVFIFSEVPEWYAIICNKFTNIDQVKSKLRNELNKGLSNCHIQHIDAKYVARYGYEIYLSALSRYKNYKINPTEESIFVNNILSGVDFDDIINYWGVFYHDKLIGYSSTYKFDTTEALYSSIKIDPSFLNYYPSNALIYKMNEHYLEELRFDYVNDGYRSLLHHTNIQDFLIKKFNFIKAGLSLRVYYKPLYNCIVKSLYPVREIVNKFEPRLSAILEMERIRRYYVRHSSEI